MQLYLVNLGIRDARSDAPVEIVLSVQPAMDAAGDARIARSWCDQLSGMYRRWAEKRRMQMTEVVGRAGAPPLFVVFGFGAWRTLEDEVGLHVLEADGAKEGLGRAVTRVKIARKPLGDASPRAGSHEALAALLDRAPSTNNVVRRYRATGSVAPGKVGGHRKRVLEPHRAFVLERIGQTPHLTLHGLKEELAARGVNVSHNAVWLFLRREGLRFKKNAVRP